MMIGKWIPQAGKISNLWERVVRFGADLLFPDFCGGCKKEGVIACDACWKAIPIFPEPKKQIGIDCWSITSFQEPVVRSVVHALKYGRRKEALSRISEVIQSWPYSGSMRAIHWNLVPIPMHPSRERRRGHNQARVLAELLAYASWGEVAPVIARSGKTESQTKLNRTERKMNVQNAFRVRSSIDPDGSYLLIDDVVTTGATLASVAAVLSDAGAGHVSAWTFARD